MSTRSNTDPADLLPLSDPNTILREGNTEKRSQSQIHRPTAEKSRMMADTTSTTTGNKQLSRSQRPGGLDRMRPRWARLKSGLRS
jgi:hypothetical protein